MRPTTDFKKGLQEIRRLCRADRFERALSLTSKLLKQWPDNPQLLVRWANLIQLQEDEDGTPTLDDARATLKRAIELDEESPSALIELGHFLYAVDDATPRAVKCFARAAVRSRRLLREALLAQADALAELGRQQEAFDCLAEARWLQMHDGNAAGGKNGRDILDRLEALRRAE